jgi:molecular chaperone DnaK (HSP70)
VNTARFAVGIDLGTSNCALSAVDLSPGNDPVPMDFPVPQCVRPGEIADRPTLPSLLYAPLPGELPEHSLSLPWDPSPDWIAGEGARWQGIRIPGRLVASAKSWLCHPAVDRSAPILPWGAGTDGPRISPIEASSRFLRHLAQAWDAAHPDAPLAAQELVLTVPASFDAVARSLTVEAARLAGLTNLTLVEEPQAAFGAFAFHAGPNLASILDGVRLVLVIDVGGGTTDFTLVEVRTAPDSTEPQLRRVAVGDHLMLGGDNMDAALARLAEGRMLPAGRRLGPVPWSQLVQACRQAKESLLDPDGPEEVGIAVAGEGSRLIGATWSTRLTRSEVEQVVLDGFFPECPPSTRPHRSPRSALQELGLPYAQDPAIPHHLAAFLANHHRAAAEALDCPSPNPGTGTALPRPDAVLFNGGVFRSPRLAQRVLDILSRWWPDQPPVRLLKSASLDLAVARGAACHALGRRGLARRITGGSSHAVYVGLETPANATPSALCVIPRGHEEGRTVEINQRTFQLALGRPVRFPLFTSTADRTEPAGAVVEVNDDLQPLPPLHAVLRSTQSSAQRVPVHLRATLTEIGTLDLSCVAQNSGEHWRLEFELRTPGSTPSTSHTPAPSPTPGGEIEALPASIADARASIDLVFAKSTPSRSESPQSGSTSTPPKSARQLWSSLERHLGPRDAWSPAVLRDLWSRFFAGATRRRRSPDHERTFFQGLGFTLRPGFGYPLDDWRCEQSASLFREGLQAVREAPVWTEFWIAWRRLAPGLSPDRHQELWAFLRPHLEYHLDPKAARQRPKPKGVQPEGLHEMIRLAAALEHLPALDKADLGRWLLSRLRAPDAPKGPWTWALGRLGSRVPLRGSVHQTIDPALAREWIDTLLAAHHQGVEGALFAITQIARLTGDRSRDLDDPTRHRVLDLLRSQPSPTAWQTMVSEVTTLDHADEARLLGDSLPVGLTL